MILFKKATELRNWLDAQAVNENKPGFVPTMGALHNGHISLIETAKKENSIVICSIFVNPTQFNDPADFKKYPVTIEKDIYLLEKAGCDVLFLPSVKEIYPDGMPFEKHYNLGYLETVLEGKYRPGHFQGVCKVVHRLLEIVKPGRLYLGQKDYQQCMVITRLIELINMDKQINVIVCPTLREKDGLAMSSRNVRLNEEERKKAVEIYQSFSFIKTNIGKKTPDELKREATDMLTKNGFKVDYVEIADSATLEPVTKWSQEQNLVCLIAAYNNEVRLIDNMLLNDARPYQ
jgi:pantoate--beta-alanine ligase